VSSTACGLTRSVRMIARNRSPISRNSGGGRPALEHADIIRWIPLPHCHESEFFESAGNHAIARPRDTSWSSSTVSPGSRIPQFSISTRSSNATTLIGRSAL
jgi:hypothetical protein